MDTKWTRTKRHTDYIGNLCCNARGIGILRHYLRKGLLHNIAETGIRTCFILRDTPGVGRTS